MDIHQLSKNIVHKVDATDVQNMLIDLRQDMRGSHKNQQVDTHYDMLFPICNKLKEDISRKTSLSEVMSLIKSVRSQMPAMQEKGTSGNGFVSVKCLSCNQHINEMSLLRWAMPENAPPYLLTNKMPLIPSTDPGANHQGITVTDSAWNSLPYRVPNAKSNDQQHRSKTAHGVLKPIHPSSKPSIPKETGKTPISRQQPESVDYSKKSYVIKEQPRKMLRETTQGRDGKLYFSEGREEKSDIAE
jgi:hypothetical protein